MDMEFLIESIPFLLEGALVTISLSGTSLILGAGIALLLVLLRLLGGVPARLLAGGIVGVIRGTPLLVQLYLVYYGLPQVGVTMPATMVAVLVLSLYMGAYLSEALRGAIESIPESQVEGALSLGLSRWQVLRIVVLPQAFRLTIPPGANQFITMLKESSLVSQITIMELTLTATWIISWTFRAFETYILAALVYLVLTTAFSVFTGWLERRTAIPGTTRQGVESHGRELGRAEGVSYIKEATR